MTVKETTKTLGISTDELGSLLGVSGGSVRNWGANAPKWAQNFMKVLVEHQETKAKLEKMAQAWRTLAELEKTVS